MFVEILSSLLQTSHYSNPGAAHIDLESAMEYYGHFFVILTQSFTFVPLILRAAEIRLEVDKLLR
jgi:hypothetical protein